MSQSETVILAAGIGAGAAVFGAIIAAVISYYAQSKILDHDVRRARTRYLFEKRLSALQNMVFAIDFIERMKDHDMGGGDSEAQKTWHRLANEVPSNLAFIPSQFRGDLDLVVRSLYAGVAVVARASLNYAGLASAKAGVLLYIDSEFENAGQA